MVFIIVALFCEAKPIIDFYDLKLKRNDNVFRLYTNDDISLLVTGVGKVLSATGVAHLLSKEDDNSRSVVINIGTAGISTKAESIGCPFLINKITDYNTQKDYYPDVLYNHSLDESCLITSDTPVNNMSQNTDRKLYDMEASGFFRAASLYVYNHQICIMKVVSDYLNTRRITKKVLEDCIASNIEKLNDTIECISYYISSIEQLYTRDERELIERIKKVLNLTATQCAMLEDYTRRYKIINKCLPSLDDILNKKPDSKHHRNRLFEDVKQRLT